jgi:hypothetical protein
LKLVFELGLFDEEQDDGEAVGGVRNCTCRWRVGIVDIAPDFRLEDMLSLFEIIIWVVGFVKYLSANLSCLKLLELM